MNSRALAIALPLLTTPVTSQALPDGFDAVEIAGGVTQPTGITFSPQGTMFIITNPGVVRIYDGASLHVDPFLDLSDEVNSDYSRGLLGIALHPGFLPDGGATSWVYLLYTVSPVLGEDLAFDEDDKYSFSRLTRYRATGGGGEIRADLSSRQVLLGNQMSDGSVPDCIASVHDSHSNGSMHFGEDGSLLIATGDGAHYDLVDTGGFDAPGFDDWTHPKTGLKGPTPADQDAGAFRSQDLRSLSGKVLRIDPETGWGYASNPFYDGDPTSNASRIWALGLRNPFRILRFPRTGSVDPAAGDPGVLAIGDVGYSTWEEMSLCTGGENFGWPCEEGFDPAPSYPAFDPPDPEFPNCNTAQVGTPTAPLAAWHHLNPGSYQPPGSYVDEAGVPLSGYFGVCAIGGTIYDGGGYPDQYDGRIFLADWGIGWIKTIELDESLNLVAVRPFATNVPFISAIERHPVNGDLYYVTTTPWGIHRLQYDTPILIEIYGCGYNPAGSLEYVGEAAVIGGTAEFRIHNPMGTQSPGAATVLGLSAAPLPGFPCGVHLPGFGMGAPLLDGELLIDLSPGKLIKPVPGPTWPGTR